MFSDAEINYIHQQLSSIYLHHTVLLGGSYLFNKATEASDLDFYVILPFYKLFSRQDKLKIRRLKKDYPQLSVIIVPKIFSKFGWYYVYGTTISGKICHSSINRKLIFRNSVKLAYYRFVKYLTAVNNDSRLQSLVKSAQHSAVALGMLNNPQLSHPIFFWENFRNCLKQEEKKLLDIFNNRSNLNSYPSKDIQQIGEHVRKLIDKACDEGIKKLFCFSLINYLIYNTWFILKGNFRFVFTNPDKFIINKIRNGLARDAANLKKLEEELDMIVFPIYTI